MTPASSTPSTTVYAVRDDIVLPFKTITSGVAGWFVRLGPVADEILARHKYPDAVSTLLGEAMALTAAMGAFLRDGARITVQTQTDGPVRRIVIDQQVPGQIRAQASFDKDAVAQTVAEPSGKAPLSARLLGRGRMAITVDPGGELRTYQGIVELDTLSLADAISQYFRQSEQLPTFVRSAVARAWQDGRYNWRAGALVLQFVPEMGQTQQLETETEAGGGRLHGEDSEDWVRVTTLAHTVGDDELTDPTLAGERLLLRLFHEEGVTTFDAKPLRSYCTCSQERVANVLKTLDASDVSSLRNDDGKVVVTCEFCSKSYIIEQ
jgi:molecular chaperone Hsp33